MELLLNLLWLAIAAFAFGAWVRLSNRKQLLLGLVALFCLLILLLPAVSITDDFHLQNVAVEDANVAKRLTKASLSSNHLARFSWTAVSLIGLWFALSRATKWFLDETSVPKSYSSAFIHFVLGRAPPVAAAL